MKFNASKCQIVGIYRSTQYMNNDNRRTQLESTCKQYCTKTMIHKKIKKTQEHREMVYLLLRLLIIL